MLKSDELTLSNNGFPSPNTPLVNLNYGMNKLLAHMVHQSYGVFIVQYDSLFPLHVYMFIYYNFFYRRLNLGYLGNQDLQVIMQV